MGGDTLDPYLAYAEKGAFVLCRTSNKGGDDLQMIDLGGGERLFERVARLVSHEWNRTGELGLVVGATYPDELAAVRRIAPDIPLLVPGIGAQVVSALDSRDYPLVQGCVLVFSIFVMIVNLLVDLAYKWIDPRVELD